MEQSEIEDDRRLAGQDPSLHPFLRAPDEESAKAELDVLLQIQAMPIIQKVINQRLGAGAVPRSAGSIDERDLDAQDLRQQTLMALTAHLWQVTLHPRRIGSVLFAPTSPGPASIPGERRSVTKHRCGPGSPFVWRISAEKVRVKPASPNGRMLNMAPWSGLRRGAK